MVDSDFEKTIKSNDLAASPLGEGLEATYEFLSTISAGGMGVVYKAKHLYLDKIVAIKMIKAGQFSQKNVQRFQREGKIASALSHPRLSKLRSAARSS